jgi:hypothetical protein
LIRRPWSRLIHGLTEMSAAMNAFATVLLLSCWSWYVGLAFSLVELGSGRLIISH